MPLVLDTTTIRRLRDALIENGRLTNPESTTTDATEDRRQASINRAAPYVETMFLMMIADGHRADAEQDAIVGALAMLTHGFLNQSDLEQIMAASESEVERHGVESRLQTIDARIGASRQDREIAFTLAAALI